MKVKQNIAISESGFVFDSNTGDSYNLNEVGQDILRQLQEEKTEEEIQDSILVNYDVEPDVLSHAYYDFIGMLRQFNLLENES
jgi:hypothetical protein